MSLKGYERKMRFFLTTLILFIFQLIIPSHAFAADVVINEIFANPENENDEFIEFYNNTDSEIDFNNWKISDKSETYIIADVKISGKGFYVLDKSVSKITLNNSDEELTLKDSSDNEIDKYSYANTIEGKSWSRVPDGSGDFVNNTDTTKGSTNAAPPSPTPTNSPTPTKTPTPSKTPTPTKAPTATKTPTSTSVPTQTQNGLISPTGSSSDTEKDESDLRLASEVDNNIFNNNSSGDKEDKSEILGESTTNKMPFLFITLGLIFLAVCAILSYFQFGDRIRAYFNKGSGSNMFD